MSSLCVCAKRAHSVYEPIVLSLLLRVRAGRADSMDNWTRGDIKREQSAVDSEIVKIMSDNDPGALRLKNVSPAAGHTSLLCGALCS